MIHLLFNVIGVTVFSVIFTILFKMFPEVASHGINSAGIATFHTGFKVVLTILMFPFADYLVKLSSSFSSFSFSGSSLMKKPESFTR